MADLLKEAIMGVLWDQELGSWFDYDLINRQRLTKFTTATIIPIWTGVDTSPETVQRVVKYLLKGKAFDFPGGIPATLCATGNLSSF